MEITDLMIGDWVQVPSELNRYKRIRSTFDIDSAVLYEPIPLTTEILEKNGFVIKKKFAQFGNFDNSPLILWHFEDNYILHHFKHELEIHNNDTGKVHVHFICENVHELQHALKLCGINKEVEL